MLFHHHHMTRLEQHDYYVRLLTYYYLDSTAHKTVDKTRHSINGLWNPCGPDPQSLRTNY